MRALALTLTGLMLALALAANPGLAASDREGYANYYGVGDGLANCRTSSGEVMDPYAMTCASRHYPLGTRLRVTNLANGRQVEVRVNDRGGNHLLDLSYGAFCKIASPSVGIIRIRVRILEPSR